jgi:hypothetical protein
LKRLFGILLILILLVPYLGTYGWLQYKRHLVRKEIKTRIISGIDKKELILLKFSTAETSTNLRWKHPGEFEYKNQMFDVVKKEVRPDSTFYYCLNDQAESRFNKHLKMLVSDFLGQNPQKKENQKRLVKLFQSLYYAGSPEWNCRPPEIKHNQLTPNYLFDYSPVLLSPSVPPPKIV